MARADRLKPALLALGAALALHLGLLCGTSRDTPPLAARVSPAPVRGAVILKRLDDPPAEPQQTALARGPSAAAEPPAAGSWPIDSGTGPQDLPAVSLTAAPPGPAPDDAPYLSRAELDRGAQALAPIDLPYPEAAPAGEFSAVLTLLIDAEGRVQRVRTESGQLPVALEDAARQAFLAARFQPGEKNGTAVRSRLRVEVRYASESPAPAAASASR